MPRGDRRQENAISLAQVGLLAGLNLWLPIDLMRKVRYDACKSHHNWEEHLLNLPITAVFSTLHWC